jgi:hypothetical protein
MFRPLSSFFALISCLLILPVGVAAQPPGSPPQSPGAPEQAPGIAPPAGAPPAEAPDISHSSPRLVVREKGTENAWVAYGDSPAFGYGPSPQNILTCLPPGEERDRDLDFRDFAEWAFAHGVTIVRSYPPSAIVGPRYLDVFEYAQGDTTRVDLEKFNRAYFAKLREACTLFRAHGIFVHLQLWQAVYWKKEWDNCYYNPDRNANSSLWKHAGPGEFVIDPDRNKALVAHQRQYVRLILEATGDLGNVYYDIMNEIGNGTGTSAKWVSAILDEIEAWESKTGLDVLVGLNDEGRDRNETGNSLSNPRMEIAFLDLGRYDEHVEARKKYKRPTFGVRNIDWNPSTREREYFSGENDISISPDSTFASRTRRTFWRLCMAKSQMCPAYADFGRLAYRGMPLMRLDLWPFQNLRRIFTNSPWVKDYSMMKIADVIRESPTEYTYELDSPKLVVGYFEAVPGTAGAEFPSKQVLITPHSQIGKPEGRILEPAKSNWGRAMAATREDAISLTVPTFIDDILAVLIESAEDPSYETIVDVAKLTATVDGGKVRLSWDQNVQGMIARVHRRNQVEVESGAPFSRLTLIAGTTELSAVDEAAGPGRWDYSIVWKDEANHRFYESNKVVVTVPDVPPVTPEIRIVKTGETRAVLWAPGNLEPDIARYEWERRSPGDATWAPIDSTAQAYFDDHSLEKNVPVEYRVRAVDLANAVSEFSAPVTVTPGERKEASAFASLEQPIRKRMRPLLFLLFAGLGLLAGILWGMRARRRGV